MTRDDFLTCSQVARMLGTSRSTVKRLCNDDEFALHRTPGGHRRIRYTDVISYLERHASAACATPETLRLSADRETRQEISRALISADVAAVLHTVRGFRAKGRSFAWCADELLVPALLHVELLLENRRLTVADDLLVRATLKEVLSEIRQLIPAPKMNAPVAVGGTGAGDSSDLPSSIIGLTLREAGWHTIDLSGAALLVVLKKAVMARDAKLVWLSYSYVAEVQACIDENTQLRLELPSTTRLAVGGEALSSTLRRSMQFDFAGDSYQHFRHYATQLRQSLRNEQAATRPMVEQRV